LRTLFHMFYSAVLHVSFCKSRCSIPAQKRHPILGQRKPACSWLNKPFKVPNEMHLLRSLLAFSDHHFGLVLSSSEIAKEGGGEGLSTVPTLSSHLIVSTPFTSKARVLASMKSEARRSSPDLRHVTSGQIGYRQATQLFRQQTQHACYKASS
jgi:hypothetical protein